MPKRTIKEIKEYKLKSGAKRFGFKTYLGKDEFGKSIKVTRKGFRTYAEAAEVYNTLRSNGTQGYVRPKQIKVDDLWKLWFETFKTQVKESNANRVSTSYRVHVKPTFGETYMDKITVTALQKWTESLAKNMVTYKRPIYLMSRLFDYAFTLGYVKENPTKKLIFPRISKNKNKSKHKDNFYNRSELNEFLKDAKEFNFKFYTYFLLLASTGLRRGEGLGLTWKDIDLKNQQLHVNRTVAIGLDNKTIIQPPKTFNSRRTIPMSDNLVAVLKKYRKDYPTPHDRLFTKRDGGWKSPTDSRDWLQQIYKKYPDLRRITVHGFRHTFATLLIEETNIKPKEVQALMGHETIAMTLDIYTHATKDDHDNARRNINALNI